VRKFFQIFFLISLVFLSTAQASQKYLLQTGDRPPDYLGKDMAGQKFNIADHTGKVIVISFWASWCGPCRKELPVLAHFQKAVGEDYLKVVAVNFMEDSRRFRALKKTLSDMSLTVTRDKRGSIGRKYGVKGIPHLFIIGKDGLIAYQNRGYGESSTAKLIKIINAQLAKKYVGGMNHESE